MQRITKGTKATEAGARKGPGTGGATNVPARVSAKPATSSSGSTNPAMLEREQTTQSPETRDNSSMIALGVEEDTSFETNEGNFTLRPASWSEEMDLHEDHQRAERTLMRAKASRRARSHSAGPPDVRQCREPEETAEAISEARKAVKESMENILDKIDQKMSAREESEIPRNKGKEIDPRNWGNIELSDGELSAGEQEIRLKTYADRESVPKENKEVKIKEDELVKEEEGENPLTSRRQVKKQIRLLKQLSKDLKQ
ncbi:hypothetical protein H0H92_010049 [Tricholoma furcatifolium]|nr:hypothetical protein H0H92_010049 [Tricholoma furcatifolium]